MPDFNPDQYIAEKAPFNPDKYLSEKTAPPAFDPDAYLAQKDTRTAGEKVSDIFFGNHPKPEAPDNRPEAQRSAEMDKYREQLPGAAAGALSVFTPLPEAAAGASAAEQGLAALGRIVTNAGVGAAVGGLTPGDRGSNAVRGAELGGMAGTVGEAIGGVAKWTENAADRFASEKALKAAGAMKADFKNINNKESLEGLGNYLLDNGHVSLGSTTHSVADSIESAKDNAGQAIGNIIDSVDAASKPAISARDIALQLADDPALKNLATTPGSQSSIPRINDDLETLYKNGDNMSLKDAQGLRQRIDDNINWSKDARDMPAVKQALVRQRNAISDAMKKSVDDFDAAQGSVTSGRLAQANDAYAKLSELSKISANKLAAEAANRGVSLTDYISGLGGGVIGSKLGLLGGLAGGPVAAVGNKIARAYGPSTQAVLANSVAGPVAGAVAHLPSVAPTVSELLAGTKPPVQQGSTAAERRLDQKRSQ